MSQTNTTTKPMQPMQPLLLSYPKAAKQIGISLQKLRDLIAADCVPAVQIGARRMVRHSDLMALVRDGTRKEAA